MATKKIENALERLDVAFAAFRVEILEFQKVYDPPTVGINEWIESISDTIAEISCELD